jgi:hypothetical protein
MAWCPLKTGKVLFAPRHAKRDPNCFIGLILSVALLAFGIRHSQPVALKGPVH